MSTTTVVPDVELTEAERKQAAQLESVWREPCGFLGWFEAVHHTTIGMRYVVTAFAFFLIAGLLAGVMRLQLAFPEAHFLSNDKYNQFFTRHGSTMMFLFAVPMMFEALSVYLVPLMVGARNIAFPRLNAYSYYLYVMGGIMFYVAFLCNTGADRGWFSYVPLAGPDYAPGKRADFWAQLITFTEVSGLAVAVETIVTVFRLRAPGMSLNRIPIFVWAQTIVSFMVIFSLPAVMLSSTMLLLDRTGGTQFFNPAAGGDVLLYQHLFWWFGHPEVYLIFIPGTAIVSTIDFDRPGTDGIYPDAEARHVCRGRLRQSEDSVLGGDIGGHARPAEHGGDRGAGHDRPCTLLQHHRENVAQAQEGTLQVDADDPVEHLFVVVLGWRDSALGAGIVEETVDGAVGINAGLHVAAHIGRPRDVGAHEACFTATPADKVGTGLSRVFVEIHHDDFGAARGEAERAGPSDVTAAAGDQCDLAGKIHCTCPP